MEDEYHPLERSTRNSINNSLKKIGFLDERLLGIISLGHIVRLSYKDIN